MTIVAQQVVSWPPAVPPPLSALPASSAPMAAQESEALASLQGQAAEVDAPMPAVVAPTTCKRGPSSAPISALPASSAPMAAANSEALASRQGQAVEVDGPASAAAATTSQTVPELPASSAPMGAAQSEALASLQGQADQPDWGDADTDTDGDSEPQGIPPDTEDEARAGANGGAQTGVWRQQIPTFWPIWGHVGPLGPVWARLGPWGPR